MKLRAGTFGPDMWPKCNKHGVAAITYTGIENTDLGPYSRENHPPGWQHLRGSAPGSMGYFAWNIKGGDAIYVADSIKHQIVGMGFAKAAIGELAYRFDANSPIIEGTERWCHLINVDWDETFAPFTYENARAPQNTVLALNQREIEMFERETQEIGHQQHGLNQQEAHSALLLETAYSRYTPGALRLIRREHATLSNQFTTWLGHAHQTATIQENQQIDATFVVGNITFLAEFKIAYLGNTKRAIREALGQILEYNHYPLRINRDR
jgi:hypothetical protein